MTKVLHNAQKIVPKKMAEKFIISRMNQKWGNNSEKNRNLRLIHNSLFYLQEHRNYLMFQNAIFTNNYTF